MEHKKKYSALSLITFIALITSLFATGAYTVPSSLSADGLKEQGLACIQVTRVSGEIEPAKCQHNLITDVGKNMIRNDMMETATIKLDKLAVGNATASPVAGDTALSGLWTTCGLDTQTGTQGTVGTGNWSITYTWTSTCPNAYINITGIYNTTTTSALFAESLWTPTTTLQVGDKLNVTYYTWVA